MPDPTSEAGPPVAVIDSALTRIADRYSPTTPPPFVDLVSRRRRRTRWHAGAVVAVAALAVGTVSLMTGIPFGGPSIDPQSTQPDQSVDAGVLINDPVCGDLRLSAQWQGPGGPLVPIGRDPAANTVTMPGNSLLYLLAEGSCVDRLRFQTDSPLVQGALSQTGGTFVDGISVVVSHPGAGGDAELELYLDCLTPDCTDGDHPIAELTIRVTPGELVTTAPPDGEPVALGEATWTVASPPAPTDTVVSLVVEEVRCASGQSAEGRIVAEVHYTETAILVSLGVERLEGEVINCLRNPPTPYELQLAEPVGDREIIARE